MITVLNETASIANHFLFELRDKDIQKDRSKFRGNLKKLGQVMGYELSKTLSFGNKVVETPLAHTDIEVLEDLPVLVTILRASMPFFNGVLDYFENSDVAFIGASRNEGEEISIKFDYMAGPSIENKTVIIVDPMLATGKSIVASYNQLIKNGLPDKVHLVSAVAAPEGIDYIAAHLNIKYHIWTAALDEKLDTNSYIVPGLGDAGDLSFGNKM